MAVGRSAQARGRRLVVLVAIALGCGRGTLDQGGTTGASGTNGTAGAVGTAGATSRGGFPGRGGVSGQSGDTSCGTFNHPSAALAPDILIVQDASGSMNDDAANQPCNGGCGATSKWAQMTPAINEVVAQTETEVNWGLKLFADVGNACGVSNNVAVPNAPNNAGAIAAALAGRTDASGNVTNGSSTPTRAAENAAAAYLHGLTDANPKFILLATDGQPNCPATGAMATDDTQAAVAAVTAARTSGIPTFVVGISPPGGTAETALNAMATEGGYAQGGQPTQYYPVTSTAEFATVLRTLVEVASTCSFSVPPAPTNDGTTTRGNISVKATTANGAGVDIPLDANDGWTYGDAGMTSILLHGAACDQWKAHTITTVSIVFHCLIH